MPDTLLHASFYKNDVTWKDRQVHTLIFDVLSTAHIKYRTAGLSNYTYYA